MPTDGADFQKRRHTQGKYFNTIKNGATSPELAKAAAETLAARIRQEKMPMFAALLDLGLDLLTKQPLLARVPNSFARAFRASMTQIENQHADLSITREVCGIMERVAVQLCSQGATLPPPECRAKLMEGFADAFLQADLLDRARGFTMKYRDMDNDSLARMEQRVLQQARPFGVAILETVYNSSKGVPSSKWRSA